MAFPSAIRLAPGIALCVVIAVVATLAGSVEHALAGRAWIEPLVLAILLGAAVRTAWTPDERWRPGIDYSAKQVLEVAIVLLNCSIDSSSLPAAPRHTPL
jgi:Predicted membrane protein